jgi:hypothetical protein
MAISRRLEPKPDGSVPIKAKGGETMDVRNNDGKDALLNNPDKGGYEVSAHTVFRSVLPRIIREANAFYDAYGNARNRPQIRDIYAFYTTVLHHVNGQENRDCYGASWLSYRGFKNLLGLDPKKVRWLASILEANGLLRTRHVWHGSKRTKYYEPIFAPDVTSDGYVVNSDGEKVEPDPSIYLTETQKRKKKATCKER